MSPLLKAVMGLCVGLTAACSSTTPTNSTQDMDHVDVADPIFGVWRMGDETTYIRIQMCADDTLCGVLLEFEGDVTARDELNPGLLAWGRKLCGATIVTGLKPEKDSGLFRGRVYNPDEGETYHLLLEPTSSNQMDARIYMGADAEELINMAIAAALGDAPSVIGAASYATRATIGKEHLSQTEVWHRVGEPSNLCSDEVNEGGQIQK